MLHAAPYVLFVYGCRLAPCPLPAPTGWLRAVSWRLGAAHWDWLP